MTGLILASASPRRAELLSQIGVSHRACPADIEDRKSTRLNSSHVRISYAVFCLKKKNAHIYPRRSYHARATPDPSSLRTTRPHAVTSGTHLNAVPISMVPSTATSTRP